MGAGDAQPSGKATQTFHVGQTLGHEESILTQANVPPLEGVAVFGQLRGHAKGQVSGSTVVNIAIPCDSGAAGDSNPTDKYLAAIEGFGNPVASYSNSTNSFMKAFSTTASINLSANLPVVLDAPPPVKLKFGELPPKGVSTRQPSLVLNYIICVEGVFPPRY